MTDVVSIITIPDTVVVPGPSGNLATITFAQEVDNGASGAVAQIDFNTGQKQRLTIDENCTVTILPPPGVGHFQLRLIQDSAGGHAVTFAGISASRWLGSPVAPAINTAANGETIVSLYWDGTNYTQSLAKVGAL